MVTHIKREVAAPDAIDSFGAFEFEWKMEIGLERESMTIQNTFAGIESIDLGIEVIAFFIVDIIGEGRRKSKNQQEL